MTVNEIADALFMEIGSLTVVEVCRYLNTIVTDLSRRVATFGYEEVSTVTSVVGDYSEVEIDSSYLVKNVFVGREELSKTFIKDSFRTDLDYRGLPFYVVEGSTLRVTYNEPLPLKLRTTANIVRLEEPFTSDLETNIPDYMLNYVVYSIGAKINAKAGDWSRQGYYKNMMDREGVLIRANYRVKYDDNWGGTI